MQRKLLTDSADTSIEASDPLSADDRQKVLRAWNQTQRDYARESTIHDLLSAQVRRTPEKIAASFEGQSLSYAALERSSNQLAHLLQRQGVGAETLVGLYVHRSLDMIIGLVAILKAGGAYIPIDPDFPPARIKLILEDAQPQVVVSQENLRNNIDDAVDVVCIDTHRAQIASCPTYPPSVEVTPENLAYIMYTSGSTGRPKGVQIEHRSVVNFLSTMANEPGIKPDDHLLAATTLSFDISVLELLLPLVTGAQVTIISRDMAMDGLLLSQLIEDAGITFFQATPVTWRLLLAAGWTGKEDLKILIGGEAVPRDLVQALIPRCAALWHMYGPTETTVWSTTCRLVSAEEPLTIGRPIANTEIYILDKDLQPLPIGAVGDLFIGGDGVARGYYKRLDLTAERFLSNPFLEELPESSSIIYKTGDRARYLEDGRIKFLGREDYQVKIRGFRIELGDVEAAVLQHPGVEQCVTIVREDNPGDKRLVSYIIAPRSKAVPSANELRVLLRELLPAYMLPAHFVTLDKFPLTPNNKINRLALPAPDRSGEDVSHEFTAAQTELEHELAALAADILILDQVGIEDSFFDLGGNSLLAMRLIAQVKDIYNVTIPAREFFQQPTLSALALAVDTAGDQGIKESSSSDHEPLLESDKESVLHNKSNLTRSQFLMWMGQRMNPDTPLYNVVQAFTIHGPVDAQAFQQAFQALVDRSDVLRTIIKEVDSIPQQHVLNYVKSEVKLVDFSNDPDPQAAYRAWLDKQKIRVLPFDRPLFETALVKLADDQFVWYLDQHHIITDALSENLIFSRVAAYYEMALQNRLDEILQPPLFVQHIAYERAVRQTAGYRQAAAYWRKKSSHPFSPTEFYGKSQSAESLRTVRLVQELGPERSAVLREIAQLGSFSSSSSDLSLFTIFVTILVTTLHRINGQQTVRLGTPFHGRPTAESLGIVGLFIEMGLLEIELDVDDTFASLAEKVLAETLSGLAHMQPGISSAATNQA
ncbi:MAG: amino acid adenylation domain-containing protein, partial [Candidatus Promineifilaceae bacterium]|nr:amino acid adenylation domain-containing protein [Candidatus Promineifilaceae bacterium]